MRIQGKLSWLMLLVAFCAVAFAALRNPLPIVAILVWTGSLSLLLAAAIVAWVDERSVFFKGVAVFGLGYAVLACLDLYSPSAHLLTTRLSTLSHSTLGPERPRDSPISVEFVRNDDWRALFRLSNLNNLIDFTYIAHGFASLIHGFAGGLFAVWIKSRIDKKRSPNIASKPDHE